MLHRMNDETADNSSNDSADLDETSASSRRPTDFMKDFPGKSATSFMRNLPRTSNA